MEPSRIEPKKHITAIFQEYEASARVLRTLTNLSNTVIETALSGQCKFLFELLQNADDAFDDESKYNDIKLQFTLLDNYFIIQHNGKVFEYNDVERICDYASHIEEVKANDLSKTGYKGLGFKSLFNLSDCIYIYSNGYSFCFDKNFWPDPDQKPWQVIPIWRDSLPLSESFTYDQPVNFIMKINDKNQLNTQLKELIDHPEVLLYLHRVNSVYVNQNGTKNILERKVEKFGIFHKTVFLKNQRTVSTWLSKTYEKAVSRQLKRSIQEVSQFIFPDKIKTAEKADFTFTLCSSQRTDDIIKIDGLCYSTLPTQLKLSLPYHVNSLFVLNLDRTQFHENEWNEFLIYQIGYFQLSFLKDLAELPNLKNYVITLLVRNINHPYSVFNKAFLKGFQEAKAQIAWLPAYKGYLLKLGEACVDKIQFFKQNFQYVQDTLCSHVIDYDVKGQDLLLQDEAASFNYNSLFQRFPQNYYPHLTEDSYKRFLNYIYEISQKISLGSSRCNLEIMPFLKTKSGSLISPKSALLEEEKNPIPDFAGLNPVDNKYLPENNRYAFKYWLANFGARQLCTPVQILKESVFQWINSGNLQCKMNMHNHEAIIGYLAKNFQDFSYKDSQTLEKNLLILTKSNKFSIATSCHLPNAFTLEELGQIMPNDQIISPCYDLHSLKTFFSHLGISDSLSSSDVFRKCILVWIENGNMKSKLTIKNYIPIVEFLSNEYKKIEYLLSSQEKYKLREMPILTCTQTFVSAKNCYFDTAVPDVKGFEDIIEKDILVSTQNISDAVKKFLSSIGVRKELCPKDAVRKSVLKWIQNEKVHSRINLNNHYGILNYIAGLKNCLYELETKERETLKKLPVLTKSNKFKEIRCCFWQTVSGSGDEIPKLELIVSADELISSVYYENVKESPSEIENLLNALGARHLEFTDIYDRYCDHLTDLKSMEWFFNNLMKHWKMCGYKINKGELLNNLKAKSSSFCVLSRNGKMYHTTELYSFRFLSMYNIDKYAVPLLPFDNLAVELEKWLGIKQELELARIMQLLEAFDKKQNLGEEVTLTFFKTLLQQLQQKDKSEIKKYPLKLLSKDNKLTPATSLYYFIEEDAECLANSCYLKRIHGMSHDETSKLAELCGVNLLKFRQEVSFGEVMPTLDTSLQKYYLERLPFIVLLESKELNESSHIVLKKLLLKIKSIELYECQNIFIKYPFGEPVDIQCHFDNFKIYVIDDWNNLRTKIHAHITEKLALKSDITEILDMVCIAKAKKIWFRFNKYDPQELFTIEEELKNLLLGQELEYIEAEDQDAVDEGIILKLPTENVADLEKIKTTATNQSAYSRGSISNDDLLVEQDTDFEQLKATPMRQSVSSSGKNINKLSKQNTTNLQEAQKGSQTVHFGKKSTTQDSSFKQNVDFGKIEKVAVNQSADSGNDSTSSGDLLINQDISQRQDTNFELEKPTYDNTLKEFYLQRLPCIVHLESKKQNDTPKKVLKSLYKKISSIELYQCSDIHIHLPYSYTADTNCFFDDLKIYVVGKWSDRKFKIHQYIKEKLGLLTDVAEIINVESVSEMIEKEVICSKEDESQKLHEIEEIKTLISTEEDLTNELQLGAAANDKEHAKDTESFENKELVAEAPTDEKSEVSFNFKPRLSRPHYSMQFTGSRMHITFVERIETAKQYDPTSVDDEDAVKYKIVKSTPLKQSTYSQNRAQKPHTFKSYSLSVNLHAEPASLLQDITDDESHLKRLGEKYIFIYLQDYYKNKFPDAEINSQDTSFILQWQSHIIEIIWLNNDEDKGLEYDLLLKKNKEVKEYIAVKSVNQAKSDLFNMIHSVFARRNKFVAEHPELNAKYCIYCILYDDDSLLSLPEGEEMANVNALYKILSLKV